MSDVIDTSKTYDSEKYAKAINASVDAMVKFVYELSLSQVTVALQKEGFTKTLTQQDIEAYSTANLIDFAKQEKAEMLKLATEHNTNSIKATTSKGFG